MIPLLFIRHGPTVWNAEGRIQGQTDIELSDAGRAEVATWSLPAEFRDYQWTASPLSRAMGTAKLLGASSVQAEPRLTEMNWGTWEGHTLAELRSANGADMAENEARGLDFRPPQGESPRMVQLRLQDWVGDVRETGHAVVAVTHKGVIRAALALATGWDMAAKSIHRLKWDRAHLFGLSGNGKLSLERYNIRLVQQ